MKKSNIIWGIILVVVGGVLILDRLNLLEFGIFFKGWWTLFIIILISEFNYLLLF